MAKMKNASKNLKGRDKLEDLHVDGRIILKLILRKQSRRVLIGLISLGIGTGGALLQ
jgi:hypothetical protein